MVDSTPFRQMPSLDGTLSLCEAGTSSPRAEDRSTARNAWIQRWCILTEGTLQVYRDRATAVAQPEKTLRSIPLHTFQKLKTSGDYGAHGTGQWELTLFGEAPGIKAQGLSRSSTSGSLSHAFERGPLASKRSVGNLPPRQWNDTMKEKPDAYPSTWHTKFAFKSKRLYQLMSGSGSTQSLSEQVNRSTGEGAGAAATTVTEGTLPSIASSSTLRDYGSFQKSMGGTSLASTPSQTTTLVLRATDAQSMAQWAEALSRSIYDFPKSFPSPALSTTSLNILPSHARRRRPQLAVVANEFNSVYQLPSSNSSTLVSAAMASRRKRNDSNMNSYDSQYQDESWTEATLPAPAIVDSPPSVDSKKKIFTAADKFIKARRRASAELFAAVNLGRRSGDLESNGSCYSQPTTSSGVSDRSSFYCKGESTPASIDKTNRLSTSSFAPFSSPLLNGVKRSASKRSTSSQSTRNSLQITGSSTTAAFLFPSSFLSTNPPPPPPTSSKDDEDSVNANSPSGTSQSTLFSPSPQTPSLQFFESESMEDNGESKDRRGMMKSSNSSVLGLNLFHDQKSSASKQGGTTATTLYPNFNCNTIIVESPSKEDLATLLPSREEVEGKANLVPVRQSNKLIPSPSLPTLHQAFFKPSNEDLRQPTISSSPSSSRFSTLGKLSGRRTGILTNRLHPTKPLNIAPRTLQRELTSSSSSLGGQAGGKHERFGSKGDDEKSMKMKSEETSKIVVSGPPVVERILPPEEMIATIDRLKGQSSTSSLRSVASWQTRGGGDSENGERERRSESRNGRPRTSPGPSLARFEVRNEVSSRNQSTNRQVNPANTNGEDLMIAVNNKWESNQRLRSLPAPPRINRKLRTSPSALQRDLEGGEVEEDKENQVIGGVIKKSMVEGEEVGVKPVKQQQQQQQQRILRTSISESFSSTLMNRSQWQMTASNGSG